ncbi:DUF924 family protein [Sphingomonas sp.]|uniref:DUF924 family protein n=1 Tax=Sphingomonas sp. TaxID=28214 RepID=UPI0025D795F7|nr:DUF924 family protein [Sphingomonas sp.]
MADALGAPEIDVHASAREVLAFWFALTPEQQFAKSDALDAELRARFGALRDAVLASGAVGWREDAETLFAAIILLDQFSRNLHRGSAEAFAADPRARELALAMVAKGWDAQVPFERRRFVYLPFEHAEDAATQALSLEKFEALGDAEALDYARAHAEVIARFGRFPSRNATLGRESTAAELEYLSQPGSGW